MAIQIPEQEIEFSFIRAQGAGGQNVNKVSSAVHLRFDIQASSLPDQIKRRLINLRDHRITSDGVVIIKAQRFRTQEKNREDAIARLHELVQAVSVTQKKRRPTKPSKGSQQRRMDSKSKHGRQKTLRKKVEY